MEATHSTLRRLDPNKRAFGAYRRPDQRAGAWLSWKPVSLVDTIGALFETKHRMDLLGFVQPTVRTQAPQLMAGGGGGTPPKKPNRSCNHAPIYYIL